ncbi:eukaryotic porin protein [Besnoitia besnoiti]|uniref:Eukaryotic porin protein n=1 Tax=Besnoitia besnoiti TaxID=94643 RepID=A0A2A9MPH8_BESBE|nr:eukaryotic porin protein [Besnoitia besnoiti]PFH37740.1 eukaryotic porin protein [Besnoitia besnoiti]
MVLFRDLNKASADLLTKGYPHEKAWDLEYKYKSKNPEIVNTASVSPGGAFDASSKLKYCVSDVTTEVKMMATGKSTIDVKYAAPKMKGLTLGAKFDRRGEKTSKDSLDISAEYKLPTFHSFFSVNPISSSFSLGNVVEYNALRVGSEVSGKLDASAMKYALGASYTGAASKAGVFTVSVKTAPHGDAVFGRMIGNVHGKTMDNKSTELAAEVDYNIVDGRTNIQFGGLWYLNDQKDTYLKAKLSQNARMSVALTHRVCDYVSATIGSQIDVTKPSNPDAVKHGLKLEISA